MTQILDAVSIDVMNAIAQKFAKQPKAIKQAVRTMADKNNVTGDDAVLYAFYLVNKTGTDYINSQMRDIWIQRLEVLVPRLNTSDENLKKATDKQVASIALEIDDVDQRGEIITILKRNLLPKSTNVLQLVDCFDRLEQLFISAWKA